MNPFLLMLAVQAAQPAPTCAAFDQSLPAALAGWTSSGERLEEGRAVTLRGEAARADERPGLAATSAFSVPLPGRYGIALDQAGWIDVLPVMDRGPGRPVASTGHAHGPPCSTIRKIVWFDLNPGTYYSLALTGLPNAAARVMLIAPPAPEPPAP